MPARGPKLVGLNTWPWIWSSALYSSTEPHLCPAAHEYNIRAAYAEHRRAGTWRRVDTWSANTYSVPNSVRIAEFGIGRGRPGGRGHIADARGRAEKASFKLRGAAPRLDAPCSVGVVRLRRRRRALRERAAERAGSDLRGCVTNKPRPGARWPLAGRSLGADVVI